MIRAGRVYVKAMGECVVCKQIKSYAIPRLQICRKCRDNGTAEALGIGAKGTGPLTIPFAERPGLARCAECGGVFASQVVRSGHTYYGLRCLRGSELRARGWHWATGGWWEFPPPGELATGVTY